MQMKFGNLNIHNTELACTAGLPAQLLKTGAPQVAFAGRSNVGKSSLINSLIGRKSYARVSAQPGKTITANYYDVDHGLFLVDLPGYGFARRPKGEIAKWSNLTQGYFEDNPSIALVLQLFDSKIGLTEDDRLMLSYLEHYNLPYILIATKCDRLRPSVLQRSVEEVLRDPVLRPGTRVVLYSAAQHSGREAVWEVILDAAGALQVPKA